MIDFFLHHIKVILEISHEQNDVNRHTDHFKNLSKECGSVNDQNMRRIVEPNQEEPHEEPKLIFRSKVAPFCYTVELISFAQKYEIE